MLKKLSFAVMIAITIICGIASFVGAVQSNKIETKQHIVRELSTKYYDKQSIPVKSIAKNAHILEVDEYTAILANGKTITRESSDDGFALNLKQNAWSNKNTATVDKYTIKPQYKNWKIRINNRYHGTKTVYVLNVQKGVEDD